MTFLRVTMNDKGLLSAGYPRLDLCEVEGERVVRRIQVWEGGKAIKQSLEGADEHRIRKGLRESVPDLQWNADQDTASVEEITRDDFEKMWSQAELVGEGWD